MSVIIRLQNLPWSANALDIRQFFRGLNIPEGGVHIVGGELGDAFIAFSTDEDARQAFNLNGGKIKEVQIKLMLSSRTEMQKVIEAARNPLAAFMPKAPSISTTAVPAPIPAAVPELVKRNGSKEKEKRERRRSRSRDHRDHSRERDSRERERRDRRRRGRSRSRSRDRRDRRRRDRSYSKDRRSNDSDYVSKERNKSEDRSASFVSSPTSGIIQTESNKAVVWSNNVPVVQTPTLLNSLLPAQLRQNNLILNYRNGFQSQVDALQINRLVNSWNALSNQSLRPETSTFQDELKAVSNIIGNVNRNTNFESDLRSNFDRGLSKRVSRFDAPYEKRPISQHPPSLKRPHPLDRLDDDNGSETSDRSNYDRPQRPERYDRERQVIKECCIKLQPFYGGYGEVRKFFNGLFIHNNGIKFLNDDNGKRTGVVFVRFASPTGKDRALERIGMMLRGIAVEISDLTDEAFNNAIDRYQPSHREREQESSCLLIEDLPLFTKEQDMLKIFADYPLQQILLENKHRYLVAYIKFSTSKDAQRAAKERIKYQFDGKPLQMRLCSDEEYFMTNKGQDDVVDLVETEEEEPEISVVIDTDCVSLSGLPKKTTDRDVSDFFSDVAIVPMKIHLMSSNFGFTGQAYCEFSTIQDTKTALQKNGLPLGSGIVKVQPILRTEMEQSIGLAIPRDPVAKPLFNNSATRPHPSKNVDVSSNYRNNKFTSGLKNEIVLDKNVVESAGGNKISLDKEVDHDVDNEIPNSNKSYENSTNKNYKMPENEDYDTTQEDQNYDASPDDDNYNLPPDDENYDMPPDVDNDNIPHDTDNYEPSLDDENYERPDDNNYGNYNMRSSNRNYSLGTTYSRKYSDTNLFEMHSKDRNFDRLSDNRVYQTQKLQSDSRHYDSNIRNYESPQNMLKSSMRSFDTSRGMPPPLMSLTRIGPPRRQFASTTNSPDITSPGCTILMENVPYKAGLDEILAFFDGYDVLADNVLRRYNDNGTPSGEAKVIFNSKEDAYQALQGCNLHKLRDRTVYLSQC